ncbi:SGNH/GDSL hydrolase family protein [Microbacterium binotii]|uniref:SGNH hydrolase-type esterase domain-containing protein n=1 Tax=Microbacterium binotii TaxID=462710 RepID=A0ABP6BM71_9MICO
MVDLPRGFVAGRFVQHDGVTPESGTVKLTPLTPTLIVNPDSPFESTTAVGPATLDIDGGVIRPKPVIATRYKVTFSLAGTIRAGFEIDVTTDHTDESPLDLTLAAPLEPLPTVKWVVNEQVYVDTLAASSRAEQASQAADAAASSASAYRGEAVAAASESAASATAAGESASDARDARDGAVAAKEAAESIPATTDALMASILADPESEASSVNKATIASAIAEALEDFDGGEPDYWQAVFALPATEDIPTITVVPYVLDSGEQLIREKRTVADGPADLAGDTHFRYDGMMTLPANAQQPSSYVTTDLLTGGASQAARYQMRIQTITSPVTRVKFKMRAAATSMSFRISVNGRWITLENTRVTGLTAGSAYSVQLDFPTAATRLIQYEGSGGNGFGGVAVALGATLTRPSEPAVPVRLAILGDSFSGGASNPPDGAGRIETWANFVGKLMGATSMINFGIGGTGYLATANTFSTRVADIVAFNPTHVLILGSRNDGADPGSTLNDAVAAVLSGLSSVREVFVSGPSTSGFSGNNNRVKAATLAAGRPFLDGIAGAWITSADIGTDGVHPTFAGHQKIARGFYEEMRAVGERPLVYVPSPDMGDDFNRSDTAAGLGNSSITGATWSATGGGTSGIESNRGYVYNSTVSVAYRHLAAAATGQWDWDVPVVGSTKTPKVDFNYSGGNDHFRVYGDGTNWRVQRRTTANGSVDVATSSVPVADGDHVRVTRDGSNLVTVKINGTTIYSATETANATATAFGILGSNANNDTRYDNVTHTPTV